MRAAYFGRLAEFGVEENSRGCGEGSPGEGVDTPGLEGFELRLGCYVDADGVAQVRMAFPSVADSRSVYVGAASEDASIEDLLLTLFGPRGASSDAASASARSGRQRSPTSSPGALGRMILATS